MGSPFKFTINKDLANEFIITIKKNDTLLPIEIDPSDTFKLTMFQLDDDDIVCELNMTATTNGQILVHSALEGQILVIFNKAFVSTLDKETGAKEDRYYVKPLYRIAMECSTVDNGNFIAKIPLVYVE